MKTLPLGLCFGLAVFAAGCVEFEGQSLTYRHDRKNDRLLVFQEYQNIHATGDLDWFSKPTKPRPAPEAPSPTECRELESVMKGQRTFFFANCFLEYDRDGVAAGLAEVEKELPTAAPADAEYLRRQAALMRRILDSVAVANGDFFLDDSGRLCGYQCVVVDNLSELVTQANDLISAAVVRELPGWTNDFPEASRETIRAYAGKRRWIQMEGNEIRLKFPATSKSFEEYAQDPWFPAEVATTYAAPFCEVSIGRKNGKSQTIARRAENAAQSNLVAHVRATYGIAGNLDVEKIRNDFLATGAGGPAGAPL